MRSKSRKIQYFNKFCTDRLKKYHKFKYLLSMEVVFGVKLSLRQISVKICYVLISLPLQMVILKLMMLK